MAEKTADDVMKLIKDEEVAYVDIRFCDLPGVVQHFSIPASAFDESVFEDGLAFDGSSVRGFQSIHESDMMLLPDPETARIDPFRAAKTVNLNFFDRCVAGQTGCISLSSSEWRSSIATAAAWARRSFSSCRRVMSSSRSRTRMRRRVFSDMTEAAVRWSLWKVPSSALAM